MISFSDLNQWKQEFKKKCITGQSQRVTKGFIKKFVKDLGDHLSALDPSELYILFQAQGINRSDKNKYSRTFDSLIDAVQTGLIDKQEIKDSNRASISENLRKMPQLKNRLVNLLEYSKN